MPVVGVIWSVCHRTMLCLPTFTAGIDRVVVWTEAREHLWIGDCVTVTVYRGDLERTKHSKSIGSSQARGFVETSLFQDCVKTKQSKINFY